MSVITLSALIRLYCTSLYNNVIMWALLSFSFIDFHIYELLSQIGLTVLEMTDIIMSHYVVVFVYLVPVTWPKCLCLRLVAIWTAWNR